MLLLCPFTYHIVEQRLLLSEQLMTTCYVCAFAPTSCRGGRQRDRGGDTAWCMYVGTRFMVLTSKDDIHRYILEDFVYLSLLAVVPIFIDVLLQLLLYNINSISTCSPEKHRARQYLAVVDLGTVVVHDLREVNVQPDRFVFSALPTVRHQILNNRRSSMSQPLTTPIVSRTCYDVMTHETR